MAETLPPTVFDAWLRSRGVRRVTPIAGGLSGAVVFHAVADDARGAGREEVGETGGAWAVRGWPEGVSSERVAEVHRIVQVALRAGCRLVPAIEPVDFFTASGPRPTHLVAEGRVWECCQWMAGRAPHGGDDLLAVLTEAATGVAHFHRAVASLGESHVPVPAVQTRLQRLAQLDATFRDTKLRTALPRSSASVAGQGDSLASLQLAVECLRENWASHRRRAAMLLEPWATRPLRQQFVLRDIHLENALFVDGRMSGIVDFDAIRVDSPATDLARLVGSAALLPQPASEPRPAALPWLELWSAALAAYRAVGAFSTEEEQLARVLAEVNPLVVVANWVVWVLYEGRVFPGPDAAIARRIDVWTRLLREQTEGSCRIQL